MKWAVVTCNACGNVWPNDTGVCEGCGARDWVVTPLSHRGETGLETSGSQAGSQN